MSDIPRFNWFGLSSLILFVAGIGFFALSVLALGVWPGIRMNREILTQAPASEVPYSPSEERGRHIFASFDAQQIADLSVYVRQLHNEGSSPSQPDAALAARGAALYAHGCTACHGMSGGGDGPASMVFEPRPFDFRHLRPDAVEIDRVLREGVAGSAMPAFPGLDANDRAAITAYVRSLYDGVAERGSKMTRYAVDQ